MMLEREPRGDVRRAADYFKLIRYSFSGGAKSFAGKSCDIRRFSIWSGSAPAGWLRWSSRTKDCVDLIRQYDREDAISSTVTRLTTMRRGLLCGGAFPGRPPAPPRCASGVPGVCDGFLQLLPLHRRSVQGVFTSSTPHAPTVCPRSRKRIRGDRHHQLRSPSL